MFDTATLTTDNWTEDPTGLIEDAGDVGGDIQASDAFNRRWAIRLEDGKFCVLDFYVYWAKEDPQTMTNARTEPWVQVQVWYTTCTDPNDVGSTEVYSDIRHWDGDLRRNPDDGPREVCLNLGAEDLSEATSQMGT